MSLNYISPYEGSKNKIDEIINKYAFLKIRKILIKIASILASFIGGMSCSTILLEPITKLIDPSYTIPEQVKQNALALFKVSSAITSPLVKWYLIFSIIIAAIKFFYTKEKDFLDLAKTIFVGSTCYFAIKNIAGIILFILNIFL